MILRSPTAIKQGFAHPSGESDFAFASSAISDHDATDSAKAAVGAPAILARTPFTSARFGSRRAGPGLFAAMVQRKVAFRYRALTACGISFEPAEAGVRSGHKRNQTRGISIWVIQYSFLRQFLRFWSQVARQAGMATAEFKTMGQRESLAVPLPVPLSPTSQAGKQEKAHFMGQQPGLRLASFRALPVATDLTSAPRGRTTSTTRTIRAHRPGGPFAFRARRRASEKGLTCSKRS